MQKALCQLLEEVFAFRMFVVWKGGWNHGLPPHHGRQFERALGQRPLTSVDLPL